MSIPLKDSPFQGYIPCKFAKEHNKRIECDATESNCVQLCSGCEHCPFYEPWTFSEFHDYSSEHTEKFSPGKYIHFKGALYEGICTGKHSETSEIFVIYKALYPPFDYYVRPLSMFLDDVEDISYHYRGPRFRRITTGM